MTQPQQMPTDRIDRLLLLMRGRAKEGAPAPVAWVDELARLVGRERRQYRLFAYDLRTFGRRRWWQFWR